MEASVVEHYNMAYQKGSHFPAGRLHHAAAVGVSMPHRTLRTASPSGITKHIVRKASIGFADERCTATQVKRPPTFSTAEFALGAARRCGIPENWPAAAAIPPCSGCARLCIIDVFVVDAVRRPPLVC